MHRRLGPGSRPSRAHPPPTPHRPPAHPPSNQPTNTTLSPTHPDVPFAHVLDHSLLEECSVDCGSPLALMRKQGEAEAPRCVVGGAPGCLPVLRDGPLRCSTCALLLLLLPLPLPPCVPPFPHPHPLPSHPLLACAPQLCWRVHTRAAGRVGAVPQHAAGASIWVRASACAAGRGGGGGDPRSGGWPGGGKEGKGGGRGLGRMGGGQGSGARLPGAHPLCPRPPPHPHPLVAMPRSSPGAKHLAKVYQSALPRLVIAANKVPVCVRWSGGWVVFVAVSGAGGVPHSPREAQPHPPTSPPAPTPPPPPPTHTHTHAPMRACRSRPSWVPCWQRLHAPTTT